MTWAIKEESMCYKPATYPVSISAEDLYYMRNEIRDLRKDIAELREEVRRAIYRPTYPTYVMPYPDIGGDTTAPIVPSGKGGKTTKWPF